MSKGSRRKNRAESAGKRQPALVSNNPSVGSASAAPALPEPLCWAREFLPEYFTEEPAPFHIELMSTLVAATPRFTACVAPRGHAKSTCAALAYPLWCICEHRRKNIVIITQESSLATQFLLDIRRELETNERILAAYGDLCVDVPPTGDDADSESKPRAKRRSRSRWSQTLFTTNTGVSVQARGTGASFRGARIGPHRPDLVICDDIEKDEHVQTEEGRRKLEHWLRRVVMPALAPEGQLLVLGSLIHHDSLLANLRDRKRFPRWTFLFYRALEADPHADGDYRLRALWPARWPVEKLQEERQRIGTLAFEQEYQGNPVDDSQRVFHESWLRRWNDEEFDPAHAITLMAVDPATGAAAGDYFAVWVGSVDTRTGVIYTRELTLERIGIVLQVRRILDAFDRYRPVKIGIETVAYQVALKEILEELSRQRRLYLPLVPIQTTANKRARIEGIAPFFENGMFRLPLALSREAEQQFLQFPKSAHDDAPDVCAMGVELARATCACTGAPDFAAALENPFARRGGW